MNSQNPYTQSEGFVNLLTSQLVNDVYAPVIDLGSSEVLVFSTQTTDDPSVGGKNTPERRKWSPKEDVILISAWFNTSKDPVVGNDQKAAAFWSRIILYYNSSPLLGEYPRREIGQCKQRWGRINDQVCKFVGCYEAAMKERTSGQNENDVMKAAHEIFFNDQKIKFVLEHAWRELRHDQKWCRATNGKDNASWKRKKCDEGSTQSPSPVDGGMNGESEGAARPPGVKAAKGKSKKAHSRKEDGKDLMELQSVYALKKQDLDARSKLESQKTLNSLLAKHGPLSDMEEALKMKLITELLG
ncbi:glutathione S-transferase T3-like [Eutrema salsugineum]|uniref:glutathione S-transferase T3-like n=1 Tax=Eutrema salsugineum TaxID=72664 RepID=UPI000CECE6EE|nr:glutathione S-transferase T3-like [Eutrema salsugineum]